MHVRVMGLMCWGNHPNFLIAAVRVSHDPGPGLPPVYCPTSTRNLQILSNFYHNHMNIAQNCGSAVEISRLKETLRCLNSTCLWWHTVGAVRNETLVFVNFSAKDASKLKISVPIIKRRSWGFQNAPNLQSFDNFEPIWRKLVLFRQSMIFYTLYVVEHSIISSDQ